MEKRMKLHTLGMDYRHERGFMIERENGSGDNLLLIFLSPARLVLPSEVIYAPPESAILYRRGTRQSYGSDGGAYANHWLHMECPEDDPLFTILPFDSVIRLGNLAACEAIMTELSHEQLSDSPFRERYIDLLIRMLLLRIAESVHTGRPAAPRENIHAEALRALRAELYTASAKPIRIADLAERLNLSEPYFQALYKAQFGVSCYEDILRARLKTAKYYLETTALSIKEVAALCGYENAEHFMRQFKKRTGRTPSEFRLEARKNR
ncbi:MAG: AraC family transcriptional regulator [Eubacterium sp.]|nr:AraC family transcriptional regulator [Eubacterium sp.]MCM1417168.1 AraC family transcriptional regulator [Roseburia sp.]